MTSLLCDFCANDHITGQTMCSVCYSLFMKGVCVWCKKRSNNHALCSTCFVKIQYGRCLCCGNANTGAHECVCRSCLSKMRFNG